jgi:membrane protein DedA with SNARE-associated domain
MSEWIVNTMDSLGYGGIALLMFLENLFPPIPSELIMPLAGFTVAQGKMEMIPVLAAGIFGTVLGAFPWYYLGKFIDEQRLDNRNPIIRLIVGKNKVTNFKGELYYYFLDQG